MYALRASEVYNDYAVISSPYDEGEYLVIENRQPLLFDVGFWGGGGIVIYKVDENTGVIGNRNRGGPFQPGWPGNGNGFTVSVLQADGLYELEQGLNNGDEGDLWRPGQSLGPGNGELEANTAVYPNTDGYTNNKVKVTGFTIDSFSEIEPGVWSFRVTGLGGGSPTNAPVAQPTNAPVPAPTMAPVPPPTRRPTSFPTATPTERPTNQPSVGPSSSPTAPPSLMPTVEVTAVIFSPSDLINPGNDEKTLSPILDRDDVIVISTADYLTSWSTLTMVVVVSLTAFFA